MTTNANPPSDNDKITVYVGNKAFPCNRTVLANSSPYFKAMFDGNFRENHTNRITLNELDPFAFEEILNGIDSGTINITSQNACRLLKTCSFLGLTELEQSCITFVRKNLLVDDLLEVCIFVHFLKEEDLFNTIVKHIAENFAKMFANQDCSTLPLSIFEAILSHEKLNRNEDAVLLAIAEWVKKNCYDNPATTKKLLETSKLTDVSLSTLVKLLSNSTEKKAKENESCAAMSNLKITSSSGEPVLKVYLKAIRKEDKLNTFISLVYTPKNTNKWILADDFKVSLDNLKTVVDGKRQYFLTYDKNRYTNSHNKFWMVENGIQKCLRAPPITAVEYELAISQGCVYLHCSVEEPQTTAATKWNEVIARRKCSECLYFYNCDYDEWYSTPKMNPIVKGASLVGAHNYVYLMGGLCGPEFKTLNQEVQTYHVRKTTWYSDPFNITTLPSMFCYGAACLLGRYVYLSGSRYNKQLEDGFIRFDTNTFLSEELAKVYYSTTSWRIERGDNHVLIPYKNELFAIDNRPFSGIDRYDPKTGWHRSSPLPKIVFNSSNYEFVTNDVTAAAVVSDYYS